MPRYYDDQPRSGPMPRRGLPPQVDEALHGPLMELYHACEECGFSHDQARELTTTYWKHLLDAISEPHSVGAH